MNKSNSDKINIKKEQILFPYIYLCEFCRLYCFVLVLNNKKYYGSGKIISCTKIIVM